jgi:transcriptional regulator with XRE-family HTH domain
MQEALRSRHMGKVIRAYRRHRHHGYRGISQEQVASWAYTTQAHISRLENGPPPDTLHRLYFWARLLAIPQRYLWFELPENAPTAESPEADSPGPRPEETPDVAPSQQPEAATPGRPSDADLASVLTQLEELKSTQQDLVGQLAQMRQEVGQQTGTNVPGSTDENADPLDRPRFVRDKPGRQPDVRAASSERARRDGISTSLDPDPQYDPTKDPSPTLPNPPIHIDINTAQPARIADYLLGGNANFSVDREVIEYITSALPGGIDTARTAVQADQAFLARAVRYLAAEANIRQFLRFDVTMPGGTKIHEVAQQTAPDARIVYVINDDVVLAHAHRLKPITPEGAVAYIRGHAHDPEKILYRAAETLDLAEPVGIFIGVLPTIDDEDEQGPYRSVAELLNGVASGSHLVMVQLGIDLLGSAMAESIERLRHMVTAAKIRPLPVRNRAEVSRFFDGLELVEPGVVPVDQWRPDIASPPPGSPSTVFIYGAVGRKP